MLEHPAQAPAHACWSRGCSAALAVRSRAEGLQRQVSPPYFSLFCCSHSSAIVSLFSRSTPTPPPPPPPPPSTSRDSQRQSGIRHFEAVSLVAAAATRPRHHRLFFAVFSRRQPLTAPSPGDVRQTCRAARQRHARGGQRTSRNGAPIVVWRARLSRPPPSGSRPSAAAAQSASVSVFQCLAACVDKRGKCLFK